MAVTMIICILVAVVELIITLRNKKATKKTAKKGNLHIFADLKEAMKNTKERKAAAETKAETEAAAETKAETEAAEAV